MSTLPDVCRRRDRRRRDGIQVRSADPIASQSRAPVGGAGRRRDRPRRDRPLACAAGVEASRRWRLRDAPGEAWRRCSSDCRSCGPVPPSAGFRWSASRTGWPPARLSSPASTRKGAIAIGRDADLVVWDPDASGQSTPKTLHHRHPVTPYDGRRVRGRVLTTILRGRQLCSTEVTSRPSPTGTILRLTASLSLNPEP